MTKFPDAYDFRGGWIESVQRIGNTVPPFLMRAIAEHIRTQILQSALQSQGCKI